MARAEERRQCKPMLHWCVFQPVRKLGSRSRVLVSGDASFCVAEAKRSRLGDYFNSRPGPPLLWLDFIYRRVYGQEAKR